MNTSATWSELLAAARGPVRGGARGLLDAAVRLGLDTDPGVIACSMTEQHGTGWRTPHTSDVVALELDEAQYDSGAGPCITAASTGAPVRLAPIRHMTEHYATFAATAAQHSVQASLSVPVPSGITATALNFYAGTTAAFDGRRARQVADLLARLCAALLSGAEPADPATLTGVREGGSHEEAAARRDAAVVNTAVGIVQRTGNLGRDEAYEWLISRSVRQERSMIVVARELVEVNGRTRGRP